MNDKREPVVGIDLGTTNSAVAAVVEGKATLIPNRSGGRLTPSIVGFLRSGERVVGEAARLLAEETPENVAFATKRFIGRRWSPELAHAAKGVVPYALVGGPAGEVRARVAGKTLPLTQVSAMVLNELRLDAEAYFKRPVGKAVVTVPANFDDGQRQATKEAARIAGLEVLRIVNEPTAAAVAFGLAHGFEGSVLVFDLGGGTFDVSILEVRGGVYEVKATGGDSRLGGEDFDNRIAEWMRAQLPERVREAVAKDELSVQKLKVAAEKAKKDLTTSTEAYVAVGGLGEPVSGRRPGQLETALTRTFFEMLSEPLTKRCVGVCERLMADAKVDPKSLDVVLLVGGMTRVPLVQRLVREFFGKEPHSGVNPDEVVALGAAIQADEVSGRRGEALLIDVASHSLGVGVVGGKVRRLIAKNTAIPVSAKEVFVPSRSGQKEARIAIFQGESDSQQGNARLGEVVLKELDARSRGESPIEVSFDLSSEGTLSVRVLDVSTGLGDALRIESRTELSGKEVERLAREEKSYAEVQSQSELAKEEEEFGRLLETARKFAKFLEVGANENPSDQAFAAVANTYALLDAGAAALKIHDRQAFVELSARLEALMGKQ